MVHRESPGAETAVWPERWAGWRDGFDRGIIQGGSSHTLTNSAAAPVVEVEHFQVFFPTDLGPLKAVDDVSLTLTPRRTLGLIGESGCGKTVTAQAILRVVSAPGRLHGGRIMLHRDGAAVDLAKLPPAGDAMRRIRGREIAMVFQDPTNSLSPVHTVSTQLCEAIRLHRGVGQPEAERLAEELLARVGLSNPSQRLRDYRHQLSGGIAQRVALALALCGQPRVLIADEPTTALDVAVQVQVVDLLRQVQADLGMAVLFITHDLRLARDACDEIAVMYLGRIVERAPAAEIFRQPLHPYTARLIESTPRLGEDRGRLPTIPGTVPVPVGQRQECSFAARCGDVMDTCRDGVPGLVELEPQHWVRCYLHSPQQEGVQM